MKFSVWKILGFVLALTANAAAADDIDGGMALDSSSLDDDVISVYSEACEKIKQDEPKSSVRMRATDKASFNAVSKVPEVSELAEEFDRHNFNVLVYNIVDNYVEDLAVRTTKQDSENICVEVTGYVKKENVVQAAENMRQAKQEPQTEQNGELTEQDLTDNAPDQEAAAEQPKTETSMPETQQNLPPAAAAGQTNIKEDGAKDKKKLLYIAPVEFYNNTTSESHTQSIRELFADNPDFYITDKEDLADYVVRSKVLRAKVDPINSNTNRLQMVLAMGVKIKDSGTTSVEHQNRFILFSSEEDEQKVAADLMKKLFKKASEPVLNKIENDIRKKSDNGSLITPNK